MLASFVSTRRVALGDSGVAVLMDADPTYATLRRIQSGISMDGAPDAIQGDGVQTLLTLAVLIRGWEGPAAPDAELWPPITDAASLHVRMVVLAQVLPLSLIRMLGQEAAACLSPTSAERDSSGGAPE